jgi:probable HAF family extracellular repeat protein
MGGHYNPVSRICAETGDWIGLRDDPEPGRQYQFLILTDQSMKGTTMNRKHLFSLGLAMMLCIGSAFAQTSYSFQTLNYPGDTFTQLLGINNSGDIAGYHGVAVNQGFTYSTKNQAFTNENYPKSAMTQVIGINNEPFKTSGFYVLKSGKTEGFTDYQGNFTTINYPKTAFNQLLSQNDFGQAAGYYSSKANGAQPWHPYIVDEKGGLTFLLITLPNIVSAQATGINNSGDVCGFGFDANGGMHGWLLVKGTYTQLDDPNGVGATQALGLNNNGQVVGSYTDGSGNSHGFVYNVSANSWQTIDDPAGIGSTVVNGLNDKGVLVGFSGVSPINNGFVAVPQ